MTLAQGISYDDLDYDALWRRACYFWSKIERGSPDECWLWTGYQMYAGYGEMTFRGRKIGAHRFSYLLHKGELLAGLCICHTCEGQRLCVNPRHLYQGTYRDNWLDMRRPVPGPCDYDEEFWDLVLGKVGGGDEHGIPDKSAIRIPTHPPVVGLQKQSLEGPRNGRLGQPVCGSWRGETTSGMEGPIRPGQRDLG